MRYGSAAVITALAAVVRRLLDPLLGDHFPFITLFPAVLFVAWYGGRGPALLSLIAGTLAGDFFFFQPRYSFTLGHAEDQFGLVMYGVVGIASVTMIDSLRNARRLAEEKEHQLEREIAARRAAVVA